MRTVILSALFLFVYAACSKESSNSKRSAGVGSNLITPAADTERVAINDLGKGAFYGVTGGLYPGGVNNPSGQYKKDLREFCLATKPLAGGGLIDSVSGLIGFISLGGSTSGHFMQTFKQQTLDDSTCSKYLKVLNCSNGSGTASFEDISNPNDPYWSHVFQVLIGSRTTLNQVEVIYMETEDSLQLTTFPGRPNAVKSNIEAAMRTCKLKFKNLKLVYLLGRTTTFPGHEITQTTNIEPCPYYNGWACKFAIQDQINGVAGTEYKGDSAVAPLITWGWYQWADGTDVPRKDGFTWQDSDTKDGLHATDAGADTLASRFRNFLHNDPYASIWFNK